MLPSACQGNPDRRGWVGFSCLQGVCWSWSSREQGGHFCARAALLWGTASHSQRWKCPSAVSPPEPAACAGAGMDKQALSQTSTAHWAAFWGCWQPPCQQPWSVPNLVPAVAAGPVCGRNLCIATLERDLGPAGADLEWVRWHQDCQKPAVFQCITQRLPVCKRHRTFPDFPV